MANNSIDKTWRELIKEIHDNGHIHKKDDSEIKEIINVHKFLKNPAIICLNPAMKMKTTPFDVNTFLDSIKNGNYDIDEYMIKSEALCNYVESLFDKKMHGFVYTYPNRLQLHFFNMENEDNVFLIDQLKAIKDRLVTNQGSNRAVGVLYDPCVDTYTTKERNKMVEDIPCWNWFQFLIRDNKLQLHVQFRSNDIYNAFPSNMLLLTLLGMYMTELLKDNGVTPLVFEGIYYNCTSAHYYTDVVTDETINKIIK